MINSKENLVSRVIAIVIALSMVIPASAVLFTTTTFAATDDSASAAPNLIRLQRATFDTRDGAPALPASLSVDSYPDAWFSPYLIQSDGPVTEEWKNSLRQSGIEIVSYIPDNALLVRVPKSKINSINAMSNVQWSGIFQPAYKVNPVLDAATGKIPLEISFFLEGTNGPLVRFLQDYDVEFVQIANSDKTNKLVVNVDASLISTLANFADVKWITGYSQPVKLNNPASQLLQSGSLVGGRVIADDPGDAIPGRAINGDLVNDGAGFGDDDRMIVAVCDSGIRTTHEVWGEAGKVIDNYVPDGSGGEIGPDPGDSGEHGQATASQVCGDAPGYGDYTVSGDGKDGGAFAARMIFQDIGVNYPDPYVYPPPDYYNDLFKDSQHGDVANNHIGGATLHSNSWGGAPGYGDDSVAIDEYTWDNKDFVILFAAGNDGPAASTVGSQAEAKNGIAVGACREDGSSVSSFSSRGPAVPDGRLKPDMLAVGEGITTANNAGDTSYWPDNFSGTSASTPNLAGHVTMVQQYFNDGWYPTGTQVNDNGFMPSAALVKAVLTNGAVALGTIPNMDEGWGLVQLENSLYFAGDSRAVRYIDYGYKQPGSTEGAGLCTGDYIEYTFGVDSGAQPFRVSMVYSDYKGDPSAGVMLVNDLDLLVTGPSGTFYGNNFAGGFSQTGVYDDNLNNVECVYVNNPAIGAYTIRIDAENIPIGPQDFALVISGGLSDGYGIVTTDRVTYTAPDTINIVVEDPNNPAGTVDVSVSSTLTGDSETATLTATGPSTGIFTGSINTIFGEILADGILQVNNGDTVTVIYSDTDPIHDSTAIAHILSFGPEISNVRVENIMGTAATVKWDTNIPSNSTVFYGTSADSGLWTDVQGDGIYTTTHVLQLTGLSMETLYYFDVVSSSQTGATSRDDFGGSHYSFSTVGLSTGALVLYIDDDDGTVASDGTPYNEDWENNFNAFGWTYTRWDISLLDTPTQADMEQCKMVVWVVDEGYPQIGASDRAVLGNYMEFSFEPKLYVIGQDIGWDMCDGAGTDQDVAWYEKHFHAIYEGDDADGGGGDGTINVLGMAGDPISAAYTGGISLDQDVFGNGRFWPDDITNNGGTIAWDYSAHAWGGDAAGIRADEGQTNAHTGYPGYRMVFEAWTHEMMGIWNPPAIDPIRSDIMDKSCIWLLGADHPEVTLTYPTGGEVLTGTEAITWSDVGSLNTKVFYSINGGQAWNLLYEDPTGGVNSYNWDTTTVDDGTAYQVKVLVTGVQDLTDYKTSLAFEIDNGIDGTGPAVLGGSVHVDPQPTYSPALATLTATLTDVGRGDSNIDAAEYMIDGSSALSMDPEDGSFDSSVEDVTITFGSAYSNGDHLIEVRGHDASGNWGGWSSVIWSVVNPDPLPEVTVYDNNGQGEDGTWVGDEVITWLATDDSPLPGNPISIYYSDNAGGDWYLIAAGEANDGAYTWDTNSVLDGSEYMIRVVCTDSVPQDGSDDSDATFYIDNGPDNPVITVTSPDGGEFFQIEQLNDITWTATDADPGDVVTIGIEYCNDWPIATWIPVASGEINDEIYPWNVPVDFTTTARVRITGTDTTARTGTDTSNGDFEIGSELFLQVQASAVPPYEILNTDGFEGTIQEANTVPIPGAGSYLIGDGWITDSITTERDIAGDWTFNIFGKITGVTGAGSLRADVYSVINGFLFSSTCPEDVAGHDTYYEFSWTEVGVGSQTIPDGDRVYVEFYVDATAGGGSTQSDETLNPGFDTAAGPEWAYSGWLDTGGGNAAGAYNGGGGNPGGWVDILLTPAGAGPASEETYAGYWEQSFTTGFVPTSATLDFDWSCTAFGTGDANLNAIVFIDTASGAPSNEVWNSGAISGITGWASVAGFDVSSSVTADTTYYLKIAARDTDLARFETAREIGFDNVMVSWEEIIPVPVFTIGHDNSATPSSVCPALNLGGPPPVPIQYDIDTSDESANGWVFVSFPITATGDVETIFDDAGWGGGTTTWDRIYWYDPSDTGDHWKCYDPAYPGTQDMPISVNNKMGFWVHLGVNDNTLRVGEGFAPAGTTIDLVAGWNLVGFPSLSGTYSAGDLKADSGDGGMRIECFNDAAAYDIEVMPDGDNFQAGNAYWVFATAAYPWIVAP